MALQQLLFTAILLLICTHATSFPSQSLGKNREEHRTRSWLKQVFLKDVNGGIACAVCSVLTGLMEQLAEIHNASIVKALDMFCHFLPAELQGVCTSVVQTLTPELLELLEKRESPDVICYAMGICKNDTGEFCRVFPPPKLKPGENLRSRVAETRKKISPFADRGIDGLSIDICDVFKPICDAFNNHTPLSDDDSDHFSNTMGTIRGYYWRGKDCNDNNPNIYPGRHTVDDSTVDTNCNGIVGVEPGSGQTYESLWCNGTQQMGTIVLGDSASAHFRIPPAWFTSREMSEEAFKDLFLVLENEFDWPMMSSVTGFMNSTWPVSITGKVDSYYLRLHDLNRCNHRDYQNVAVNGARAKAMAGEIVKTFARRGVDDNPVFLSLSLIGNDVCDGHPDMKHWTKPDDFYKYILETLRYVDQHVAPGSTVIGMGLVDGQVLYDVLSDRVHPIGSLHNDVTYSRVYDYLNCLQISPCFGWLNSNETWRNLTTERAMQLNVAFQSLVANNTFKNFKIFYVDPPLPATIRKWKEMGREAWKLIEPVDGFHPSQAGNALTTEITFQILARIKGALPKSNPFNEKIKEKFGDQGGYL